MDLKVMIIDDEKEQVSMLETFFELMGIKKIIKLYSGEEAVDIIEKEKPDVVFLDIQLRSRVNGLDILRTCSQNGKLSKICMISAYKDEHESECLELGAYEFFKKPVSIEQLENLLIRVNEGK